MADPVTHHCPNCSAPMAPHRACPSCGHYRGRAVVRPREKGEERERYASRVEVLTPICKAWASDWGFRVTEWCLQVYGGYGYTSDYPVEQHLREEAEADDGQQGRRQQALDHDRPQAVGQRRHRARMSGIPLQRPPGGLLLGLPLGAPLSPSHRFPVPTHREGPDRAVGGTAGQHLAVFRGIETSDLGGLIQGRLGVRQQQGALVDAGSHG